MVSGVNDLAIIGEDLMSARTITEQDASSICWNTPGGCQLDRLAFFADGVKLEKVIS